jgi:hypothetical protein
MAFLTRIDPTRNINRFLPRFSRVFAAAKAFVAHDSYSPAAEETISRVGRDLAETALKSISWSVMIGALEFAATKSGNKGLTVIVFGIKAMLWIYLFYSVKRIELAVDRTLFRLRSNSRWFNVLLPFNLVVTLGLFVVALLISNSVIKAIVELQTH